MLSFKGFLAEDSSFKSKLEALKPAMAKAAQAIYDEWDQEASEDGDLEVGFGGICDEIADAISSVVMSHTDAEMHQGGHDGDDHAWNIFQVGDEAYGVDIPCFVYETGGGYSWKKIPDVQIRPSDIQIFEVDLPEE